jgi:beta-glucosidase-like glycosyl hydrolase
MKIYRGLLIIGWLMVIIGCQSKVETIEPEVDLRQNWVDSIYNGMTLKEKVGQLFMIATYSNRDSKHVDSISVAVKEEGIGGLIFFQGGPVRQANLTNKYQSQSKLPLLIGIDAEWGLNMRLDSTLRFPYNMTLGAVRDDSLIYLVGKQIGKHNRRVGIHVNFAPVVDVNTNPKNPVIGVRSFGEDKYNVTNKAIAFMEGMQSEGVLACAKHFPGHGDTSSDSHYTLPLVDHSKQRLDSIELYPYKQMLQKGLGSVMVAHLNVPELQDNGVPSSLSKHIVTDLLKNELGFEGLIMTDALNMKGAANFSEPGDIDLEAFNAGNDLLLFSEDYQKGMTKIIEAYTKDELSEERLAYSVKKVLGAKYDVGLNNYLPINMDNLVSDLNDQESMDLVAEVSHQAITLVKGEIEDNFLSGKQAHLPLGSGNYEIFKSLLNARLIGTGDVSKLDDFDTVIISYHSKNYRRTGTIPKQFSNVIESVSKKAPTILVHFGSQYNLIDTNLSNLKTVLIGYENSIAAQNGAYKILNRDIEPVGQLPVSINFKKNDD